MRREWNEESGRSYRLKEQKDRSLEGSRNITPTAAEIQLRHRAALKSNMSIGNVHCWDLLEEKERGRL